MKKYYFLFFVTLFSVTAQGQLIPTTYLTFDAVGSTSLRKSSTGNRPTSYSYYNPYICKTFFSGNYQIGIFTEAVLEPDVYSINPGVLFIHQNKKMYYEFGIGPGFEFPRDRNTVEVTRTLYCNSYLYVESNPDVQLKKGKWYSCTSFGYAPTSWGEWHMAFLMYYVSKHVAVGIHSQSYAVTGPRVQYSGLVSKNTKCTFWASSDKTNFSMGCNLTISHSK